MPNFFIFIFMLRFRKRTFYHKKFYLLLERQILFRQARCFSLWKSEWIKYLKIIVRLENKACEGFLGVNLHLRLAQAFFKLR